MDKFSPNVVIGQGLGPQEHWAKNLANKCENKGIPVWNEPLPHATNPNMEMAQQWSDILGETVNEETTAILHSASVISFINVLNTQRSRIKNLVFIAGWFEDPGKKEYPWGNIVRKIFNRNGIYHLEPFLKLKDTHHVDWEKVRNSVRNQISIIQSSNDPYVHPDQAEFFAKNIPKAKIITVENAGHFQYRPERRGQPAENFELPKLIQQKIFYLVNN